MLKNLLSLIFLPSLLFSQQKENKEAYILFDDIVGQKNLEINSGIKFEKKFKFLKNEHHFFYNKFTKGTIKYNYNVYYNIPLLYDTFEDNLIIKIPSKYDSYAIILDKKKTDYFVLNNNFFKKNNIYGYLQKLVAKEKVILFKKNSKKRTTRINNKVILSKFSDRNNYYISKNNIFYPVNSKSHWKRIFPKAKKKINSFYQNNKELRLTSKDRFYINLLKTIN